MNTCIFHYKNNFNNQDTFLKQKSLWEHERPSKNSDQSLWNYEKNIPLQPTFNNSNKLVTCTEVICIYVTFEVLLSFQHPLIH